MPGKVVIQVYKQGNVSREGNAGKEGKPGKKVRW